MNNEERDINMTEPAALQDAAITPSGDQSKIDAINALEESIIRNDTIPETSRKTPGSNGAFPVGAFDTSKD